MPRADKAAFIQGMLSEHQLRQQREATKPVPDSMEWWRDVAQGLGVELATLRATIAEQAATIAALQTAMYSGDEAGVTCACRWEHLPGGAGASGPQIRECGEHHGLRMRVEEQAATIARLEGENTRLGVVLSGEMHTVRKLQSILRYLRPALPVLQSMLSIARMDSNKAAEMLREIDAALKEQP